jgi:hypothetical protein
LFFVGGKKQPNHGRFAIVRRCQYRHDAVAVGGRNALLPN